jgi:hypothetical protein
MDSRIFEVSEDYVKQKMREAYKAGYEEGTKEGLFEYVGGRQLEGKFRKWFNKLNNKDEQT